MPPLRFPLQCARALVPLLFAMHTGIALAECRMVEMGRFPISLSGNQIHISGLLNGTAVRIFVDTGAAESLVMSSAAKRAGLKPVRDTRYRMGGVSGMTDVYRVKVDELIIGNFPVRNRVWPVIDTTGFDDTGMILGGDFWSKVDFEINLAGKELVLWENENCEKAALGYWNKDFMLARLADTDDRIHVESTINGKAVRALFDTGAAVSIIDRRIAEYVGYLPDPDGGDPAEIQGIGDGGKVPSFVGVFADFALGDLTIRNARLRVTEPEQHLKETRTRGRDSIVELSNFILGADFLQANRVLVANSQGYLYMTYGGGRVFQTSVSDLAAVQEKLAQGDIEENQYLSRQGNESLLRGFVAYSNGQYGEAEPLLRAALDELRAGGHLYTEPGRQALGRLSWTLLRLERPADAVPMFEELLDVEGRISGAGHRNVGEALVALAFAYLQQDRHGDALSALERARPIVDAAAQRGDELSMRYQYAMGQTLDAQEQYAEAAAHYARFIGFAEQAPGTAPRELAEGVVNLARMQQAQGQFGEAVKSYERALELCAALPDSTELKSFIERAMGQAREAAGD